MTRMDPPLGDLMANLRRQEVNRKINSFKAVGKRNPVTSVDVVPLQITVPPTAKKCGRPAKTARLTMEKGPSIRQPSVLNP